MDYNAEMLKLYFKEMNFDRNKINQLLNENPFDRNYCIWERQTLNNNKTLAIEIKKRHLIEPNTRIQEIVNHESNNISQFLQNDSEYTICPIDGDLNKVKLRNNLILFKGYFPNQYVFLKRINQYRIPFITGTCTKNHDFYKYMLNFYKRVLEDINELELIETTNCNQKLCILKTK